MIRIALIGYGGIAATVVETLPQMPGVELAAVLVRPGREQLARERLGDVPLVTSIETLLAEGPELVGECAGHEAVREFGLAILDAGSDLVIASIGALADQALYDRLTEAAARSGARLVLPAGAIGGMDALAAARFGRLDTVRYRSRKPPQAWTGTPAEAICDLATLTAPVVLYRGSARAAAEQYPKNANVAATVALAGLGFEATEVELVADPGVTGNIHEIEAAGDFGHFAITLSGRPSPANPKTSMLTALSMARALGQPGAVVVI
ncbi:aspartate dehydrogenase [Oceanibacterium hippocampi]|uniref:L-aspartate dehydrogenase n=1 Tax=Oceanibacterium hippocampi TaxID=745714 RepID=A0A1Y5TGC3_9PROT|nr:aspartate dehydrogenase [Oceanibacterium hippocampi]SLN63455.1 L-aspartate dehydrogenase [Oceanibacterium hippocampi]